MAERVPSKAEMREFLHRQIAEAHRMNEPERVDDMLDKLADLDGLHTFVEQVLGSDG